MERPAWKGEGSGPACGPVRCLSNTPDMRSIKSFRSLALHPQVAQSGKKVYSQVMIPKGLEETE